jgi:hypothetical protein
VFVFEAPGAKFATLRERAERRDVTAAIYTRQMFSTGNDTDNRPRVARRRPRAGATRRPQGP